MLFLPILKSGLLQTGNRLILCGNAYAIDFENSPPATNAQLQKGFWRLVLYPTRQDSLCSFFIATAAATTAAVFSIQRVLGGL